MIDKSREEFEHWCKANSYPVDKNHDSEYSDQAVRIQWVMWKSTEPHRRLADLVVEEE